MLLYFLLTGVPAAFQLRPKVDDMISLVVQELESLNVLDNTYIFVTSDHGQCKCIHTYVHINMYTHNMHMHFTPLYKHVPAI